MGMPFKVCPECGAHLDAGERCDCNDGRRDDQEPAAEREDVLEKAG